MKLIISARFVGLIPSLLDGEERRGGGGELLRYNV